MDQVYIDEFFATGRLMLSSFTRFSQHPDEQRGDELEGKNLIVGSRGDLVVTAQTGHGDQSLVLCTSVREDEELMRQFNCDGYFRIRDTAYFGRAIASRLQGCIEGLEGFCTYKNHHVIEKKLASAVAGFFSGKPDDALSLDKVSEVVLGIAGAEAFFSKRRQFVHQCEYRIIWNLDHAVTDAFFVDCPEAIQFCEKVTGTHLDHDQHEWDLAPPGTPGWPTRK
jgi:hypothetical protein